MNTPWLTHYDSPVAPSLAPYPDKPFYTLLEDSATLYPHHACTLFKGRAVSYRDMQQLSDRFAAALVDLGVTKGDRVGIVMPNIPQFVIAFFGILKAGGVVVALNPLATAREMEYQCNDAGIETLVVLSNVYQRLKDLQPRTCLKRLIVSNVKEYLPWTHALLFRLSHERQGGHRVRLAAGDMWMQDLLRQHAATPQPRLHLTGEDMALLQYSGGTTGVSKAAMVAHSTVLANMLQIGAWLHVFRHGQERTLMAIPLFHVYGMIGGMALSIAKGATMILVPNPRDLTDVLHNITTYKPTYFPGVPALYQALNQHAAVQAGKYNLQSIRYCVSGSAPLPWETRETFARLTGARVCEAYGLSEAPTCTHGNPLSGVQKAGSIGMPMPDTECKLISLIDGVTEVAPGQEGELVLRGPQVFRGYWNRPDETAHTLRDLGDGGAPWLFTGDIARMDEQGYFYLVGRKKELIKPGGFQVWPCEVEAVLALHPKVEEVAVAGVPDAFRGEAVQAWVVLKAGEAVTEDDLRTFCKQYLSAYKVPKHITFRRDLPRTAIGKVLRRELVREHQETAHARLPADVVPCPLPTTPLTACGQDLMAAYTGGFAASLRAV